MKNPTFCIDLSTSMNKTWILHSFCSFPKAELNIQVRTKGLGVWEVWVIARWSETETLDEVGLGFPQAAKMFFKATFDLNTILNLGTMINR